MKLTLIASAIAALMLSAPVNTQAAKAVGVGPSFKGPVGLQLYSLREQFKKDVPGTLDLVSGWGVKYVELAGTYGMAPDAFKHLLESKGLKAIAGHFGYEQYRDNPEKVVSGGMKMQ